MGQQEADEIGKNKKVSEAFCNLSEHIWTYVQQNFGFEELNFSQDIIENASSSNPKASEKILS